MKKQNKIFDIKVFLGGLILIGIYLLLPSKILSFFVPLGLGANLSIILTYVVFAALVGSLFRKRLVNDAKTFKLKMFTDSIPYYVKGFLWMIVTSIIISRLNIGTNMNEEANQVIMNNFPIAEILTASIFSPFIEELVFRGSFTKLSSNDKVFIIITALLFSFTHILSSVYYVKDLLLVLPYLGLSIVFGLVYKKYNNIYVSMLMHAIHNSIYLLIYFII